MASGNFILHSETHGHVSVTDTALESTLPALLLIHGNSSSSKIWRHILDSGTIREKYRVIAFDLPGHGASSDSPSPEDTYSMRGYADLAVELLRHVNVTSVAVLGWSLGGHVAIEMVRLLPPGVLKGIMIVGTPPALGLAQTDRGFTFTDGHMSLAAREHLTEDEIRGFSRSGAGEPFESWMEEDARRTHGKARHLMWDKFAKGVGVDQRGEVEGWEGGIVAVVNGGSEPFVNLDYLEEIRWKRLWRGQCVRLEGVGHAPFWERPEQFQEILLRFLGDVGEV